MKKILFLCLALALSCPVFAATNQPAATIPNARYSFVISTLNARDKFVIDSKTGRVWQIMDQRTEEGAVTLLFPIEYLIYKNNDPTRPAMSTTP